MHTHTLVHVCICSHTACTRAHIQMHPSSRTQLLTVLVCTRIHTAEVQRSCVSAGAHTPRAVQQLGLEAELLPSPAGKSRASFSRILGDSLPASPPSLNQC